MEIEISDKSVGILQWENRWNLVLRFHGLCGSDICMRRIAWGFLYLGALYLCTWQEDIWFSEIYKATLDGFNRISVTHLWLRHANWRFRGERTPIIKNSQLTLVFWRSGWKFQNWRYKCSVGSETFQSGSCVNSETICKENRSKHKQGYSPHQSW